MKQYIEDASIAARSAEIEAKVADLRAKMAKNGWEGVYISKSEHFAWITAGGCNIVTRYCEGGICAILVTMTGRYFLCGSIETRRMLEEEKLAELGFEEKSCMWYENKTPEYLADLVKGKLASDIPMGDAADANGELLDLERTLCDNEIGRYLEMGKRFAPVIEQVMAEAKPGMTENEICGRLCAAMWKVGLEPVLMLVAADERIYAHRHAIPTDKVLDKFLMISCNARYKGLITKITRMAYYGDCPAELKEQYAKTAHIENVMAEASVPGVDNLEIYEMSKKLYAEAGYPDMWKCHHQGGPQSYTNGFYLMNQDVHEPVREFSVYGYNPSITGTKTEDAFIVTAEGPIWVTYPVTFPEVRDVVNGREYVRPGILEVK